MMAGSVVVEGKTVEELQREITCSICQEHYTEPKILPCLHYYCKQCVLRLALKAGTGRPFACPECRLEATLPEGGVDELKTAFFVNRLKTSASTIEHTSGMVKVKCELCIDPRVKPEAYCRQCSMLICSECIKQHKRIKLFLTHEVTSLEDFKEGKAKPVVVKEPQALTRCADHGETIIMYCFDCDALICHCCMVKGHSDHKFEFCIKSAPTIKQELLEKLKPLKEQTNFLSQRIAEVQIFKQEIESKGSVMASNIRTCFKELRGMLDKNEQEMLDKTAGMMQRMASKLSVQESTLSPPNVEIRSVVDYTEQFVKYSTDNEVMSMYIEIKKRMEQVTKQCKSREFVKLLEKISKKEAKLTDTMHHVGQTQSSPQLPVRTDVQVITRDYLDAAKFEVTTSKPEVGKVIYATLTSGFCINAELATCVFEVTCNLKNIRHGDVTQGSVESKELGVYSIQCTPTVRGRHELNITMNGQQLSGSPFPIFVHCPPRQLTKHVKVWENVQCKFGTVTSVTSTGDILIVSHIGITKINIAGDQQTILAHDDYIIKTILSCSGQNIYFVAAKRQDNMRRVHDNNCQFRDDTIHFATEVELQNRMKKLGDKGDRHAIERSREDYHKDIGELLEKK